MRRHWRKWLTGRVLSGVVGGIISSLIIGLILTGLSHSLEKERLRLQLQHLGGKPRIAGTRISIEFLLETLACGITIPEIVKGYPSLTEEAIKGALDALARSDRITAPWDSA